MGKFLAKPPVASSLFVFFVCLVLQKLSINILWELLLLVIRTVFVLNILMVSKGMFFFFFNGFQWIFTIRHNEFVGGQVKILIPWIVGAFSVSLHANQSSHFFAVAQFVFAQLGVVMPNPLGRLLGC